MPEAAQEGVSSRTRLAVFVSFFSMGLIFATWASRIPDVKTLLGLNDAQLGAQLMALPIGQLLTMPLSGWLVARFGSRRVAVLGQCGYAVALAVLGLVSRSGTLTLGLLALGCLGNLSSISVNTQGVLAEKLYGRPMMASFHGGWSLAGLSGALLGLLAMNLGISRATHCLMVALLTIVATLVARPHLVAAQDEDPASKGFRLPGKRVLPLAFIGFCCMATEGSMFDWSGVYFREVIHVPKSLTLLGYASFMFCMALGRFLGDGVLTRWGRRRVIQASGMLMSLGLGSAVILPHIVLSTLSFMLVGFAVSTVVPTVFSLAARVGGVDPGIAIASVSSVSYLGFLVGPPTIGAVAVATSLRGSYTMVALLGILIWWTAGNIVPAKTRTPQLPALDHE